ncbi:adenylate/guanylate cyclase domain-containing protein [Methylobacterium nonmethylotrophicum]|uniref:Adenylate/guanylate cyclase domain-containing protein n=1 Tax=Methylobacterium nonmethylotrophicum TaxID=1141884 RepID=A0A4Z0NNY9_9HYPH|nr:adenylate/guanylate cyclase domain-containing protein [Methylobacterium nonmethylotrophicum]TGD97928.1 adenylate/guanylate cyclase domain-containing protein [Methylobacterium nonmethylotrophicum]
MTARHPSPPGRAAPRLSEDRPDLAAGLAADTAARLLAMRVAMLLVLLVSAALSDGVLHAGSHWFILGGYAASSLWLAVTARRRNSARLAWIATLLDAALAAYIVLEYMMAAADTADEHGTMASRLPAFLLLLESGLTLRPRHTAVFAAVVAGVWSGALGLGLLDPGLGLPPAGPQLFGLLSFLVASAFVIEGVTRLHRGVAAMLRLEHERASLARFVPAGIDLVHRDGPTALQPRHACLLALDIRGFSALTRRWGEDRVVGWLLAVRALVHAAVTEHGGLVDKYVGDGVLAQFVDGAPAEQAAAALACVREIAERMEQMNETRRREGLPPLALTASLHAGEVLVGVLDDGARAEFTVLGPAMNALARIEARAKRENLPVAVSKRVLRLLGPAAPPARRLPRRPGEEDCPDLFGLDPLTAVAS